MELNYIPNPMAMERTEKLKIFSIVALRKSIPPINMQGNLFLATTLAYTQAEAILSAEQSFARAGGIVDDHLFPFMIVSTIAEDVLVLKKEPLILIEPEVIEPEKQKEQLKKSTEDISSYVRYVFALTGTAKEKKTAETVISKFKIYATKLGGQTSAL